MEKGIEIKFNAKVERVDTDNIYYIQDGNLNSKSKQNGYRSYLVRYIPKA